jgi:hypothetical protein
MGHCDALSAIEGRIANMRRQPFLKTVILAATAIVFLPWGVSDLPAQTVRDRLWIWGRPAGMYNQSHFRKTELRSTIEPVEGAQQMGIPNVIFILADQIKPPYDSYYRPFEKLDRVYWSLVAASGVTSAPVREATFALAENHKNLAGFILDDFFHEPTVGSASDSGPAEPFRASLTPAQLRTLHERPVRGGKVPLMAVIYTGQVKPGARAHLAEVDQVSLWTWRPAELANLETNFAALERLVPGKPIFLGCYMFNFSKNEPLPVSLMQKQVEQGYQWLKAGRIAGIIFLSTATVDVGLEAVDWTREWIRAHGNESLPALPVKPATP